MTFVGDLIVDHDVNLVSAKTQTGRSSGANNTSSSITQLTGSLTAGRDLGIGAGRDLTAVASTLSAGGNAILTAQDNLTLAAAADETHSYSKSKKVTRQEDHVDQQITTLTAGGNVSLVAKQGDLTMIASKVEAGNEAYLYAGKDLNVLAAQDSDYSLYDMKKKGSFGAKKTQRDEVTDVRNIGSEIKAGGDITLQSEGSQTYQAAKLTSGKNLTLDSGGDITFEAVKDLHQESHEKSSNSLAWTSMKGKGNTDETLKQSELVAQGQLAIQAANKIHIDVKDINAQSVSQTVDAMVKADPNLAWIKQAEAQGDIDWRQVKELHDSFKYSHSGLGQGAMLAVIIVVTVLTAGAASGLAATAGTAASSAATAAGVTSASTAAAIGSAASAATTATLSSIASQAVVSTINNRGNLGAVFKETFSSDSIKGYATSALTAGFTAGVIDTNLGGKTGTNSLTKGFDLSKASEIGGFALHAGAQGVASAAIKTAIQGGSLGDNLVSSLTSQANAVVAAVAFNAVGSFAESHWKEAKDAGDVAGMDYWKEGGLGRTALHAAVGGLVSSASGGNFATGAIAAGTSQAFAGVLNSTFAEHPELRQAAAQVVGLTAAGLAGEDVNKAAWVSQMADQYNRQLHQKEALALDKLRQEPGADKDRLDAAACALTHCSASVPETDPNYKSLLAREENGRGYTVEIAQLQGTGAFDEYTAWDSANDFRLKHDEFFQRSGAAGQAVANALGAGASYAGAVLMAPGCVTVVGCMPSLGLGAVGSMQVGAGYEASGRAMADYVPRQGQAVLASFNPSTYPGEATPILDDLPHVVMAGAEVAVPFGAGRLVRAGEAAAVAGAKGTESALDNAERGALTEANFAQNRIKSDRYFSPDGQKIYSGLAGKPIQTVDDLADALKVGAIKPSQLPVDYVDMNGTRLILNTRTSTALEQAGVPRSQWFGRNQTGVEAYPGKTFNDLAADQLRNNKLPPTGAEELKSVRP
ncbi:filamentous hemagglutinin [Pseudomonas oryzihabitans]|nr:filamentous hemagglutinin [Pseudomonas oryzihabitans]